MKKILPVLGLLLLACDDGGTNPSADDYLSGPVSLAVVSGDLQTDTIQATLGTPITVQLMTDDESPKAIPGALVNFVVLENGCGEPYAGSALTDASGRAAEIWKLGTKPGTCTMEARAVTSNGTPVVYSRVKATVDPGKPARVDLTYFKASAWVGEGIPVHSMALAWDRANNPIPQATPKLTGAPAGVAAVNGVLSSTGEADAHVELDFDGVKAQEAVWLSWFTDLRKDSWGVEFSCSGYLMPGVNAPDSLAVVMERDSITYLLEPGWDREALSIRQGFSGTMTLFWGDGSTEVQEVSHVETSSHWAGKLELEHDRGDAIANGLNPTEFTGGNWCYFPVTGWNEWDHSSPIRIVRR